jgi:hypothetical protein
MSLRPFWYPRTATPSYLGYRVSETGETVQLLAPVAFAEDFLAQSLSTDRHFTTRDTAGGSEALLGDAPSGVLVLALDATNEVQLAGADFADHRPFVLNQDLIFETRVRFTVLPTGSVVACIGLCGDHNAAVNPVAESIWFRLDGSGAITVEADDTVHETSAVATGVTLVANEWAVLRIECEDTAAVRMYVNGTRVASGTTFNMSQVAALALQPVARIGKEGAATTVGTLQVDYVRCYQSRT